jgi:hypothetical protein
MKLPALLAISTGDLWFLGYVAVVLICALTAVRTGLLLFRDSEYRGLWAVLSGCAISVGFFCSLALGPVLAMVGGIYFGTAALSIVFYGVARPR